jgi:glycosyltransferase involved in cell wall biosynthesis
MTQNMNTILPITLYIPCYNAEAFLDRVLSTVMAQTYPLVEILVIDDGSTDHTATIAQNYSSKYRYPLRLIRHPQNKGLAAARNTAIRAINTEFIAALDSDVLPSPDWLENLVIEMTDEVSGVGGELLEMYQTTLSDHWRAVHMVQHRGQRRVWRPPFLWGCNTLFRRSVLVNAGLYPEYCRTNAEDVKLCEGIRDTHILIYTHLAKCLHMRRDTPASLRKNFWKWYYYGCYEQPSFKGAWASNLRHIRRIGGLFITDVKEKELLCSCMTLSMLPYTCIMDWIDWLRYRNNN